MSICGNNAITGCLRQPQHRSGLCRSCENDRLGKARQACQKCGRTAFSELCTACRNGQTEAGQRALAAQIEAQRAAEAKAAPPVLYERRIGRQVFEVVFDGSVR